LCNQGNAAVLQWKSADEINLDNYTVQYSEDGNSFRDLTVINAAGANRTYSFIHRDVKGTAYYRLKMSDWDGAYQYSEIKRLTFTTKTGLTIVPNPSNDYIDIHCDNPTELKTIQIFSVDGVILKTVRNYIGGQRITVSDLSKGIYILKAFSLKDEVLFEKLFSKM
jgi:hypothetical protein